MEAEGSEIMVADTSTTPTTSSPAPNGSTPGTPETSSRKTQKEILRERYLKGVKKWKCAVCGNTARARCPFKACKTCCNKMKNICEVHAIKSKQASNLPSLDPHDSRWAAAMNAMPHGSPYARPLYMSSAAYNGIQTGMASYSVCYAPLQARPLAPGQYAARNARSYMASQATLEQQELQRLKILKAAIQAASREAQITSTWKTEKMKEFLDVERSTEDDAFDRYMFNMALLEEVFLATPTASPGLSPDGKLLVGGGETLNEIDEHDAFNTLVVVDGLRLRRGIKATREASRSPLKITIDRSLQVLKRGQQEVNDSSHEDNCMRGLHVCRRDFKRLKATIHEGKNCHKRTDLFVTLLQETSQIHSRADFESCGEMYRQNFGLGLDVLLPHLPRNVENILGGQIREVTGDAAIPAVTLTVGDMPKVASTLNDSIAILAAADSVKKEIADKLQNSGPALDIEAKDSGEHTRHTNRFQQNSSYCGKWNGLKADISDSRSEVKEWLRLHDGFLAGRGWWKVELDELSAQIACQLLFISSQAVELCEF